MRFIVSHILSVLVDGLNKLDELMVALPGLAATGHRTLSKYR